MSNDDKPDLLRLLDDEFPLTTAARFDLGAGGCGGVEPGSMGRTAYPLRVQTGCDERCAYCIIPSTRGVSRSRAARRGACRGRARRRAAGFKEVWLVGVHLGSYGRDLR